MPRMTQRLPLLALAFAVLAALAGAACSGPPAHESAPVPSPTEEGPAVSHEKSPPPEAAAPRAAAPESAGSETATFAAGCYWCVEAVYQRIDGVTKVRSGFIGGHVKDPSYEDVCAGTTGHAEAVEVTFDPARVSYETLLDWFWRLHDPTTLNRQGADVGTQYRSAIFVHGDAQRAAAEKSKAEAQAAFADPIVTEIVPASAFYEAHAAHQNYYNENSGKGYCQIVIAPKLKKLGLPK